MAYGDTYYYGAAHVFSHPVTTPGSEPATVTFTPAGTFGGAAQIIRFSDGTGVDTYATASSVDVTGTSHVTPNVTPTESAGIILSIAALQWGNGEPDITFTNPPATPVVSIGIFGWNYGIPTTASYAPFTGTSSQGSVTFTSVGVARSNTTASVVLY